MQLLAKDLKFTLTGTLNPAGEAAYKKLQKLGKEVSFSGKTQVLIHEQSYSAKPEKAAAKGIPVINEAQLIELVRAGGLDLSSPLDEAKGEVTLDEMLGEVRGLITLRRHSETWDALCALVDACVPEQQRALVDYIDSHLARWELEDQLLCVASHDWLLQLIAGQESEKFRLVRKLDFFGQKHTATKALKVLKNANLINLRSLNLRIHNDLTGGLITALHTLPSCQDLVELGMARVSEKIFDALAEGDGLKHVTRFIWSNIPYYYPYKIDYDEAEALSQVTFFKNLTKLTLERHALYLLRDNTALFEHIDHIDLSLLIYHENDLMDDIVARLRPAHLSYGVSGRDRLGENRPLANTECIERVTLIGTHPCADPEEAKRLPKNVALRLPPAHIEVDVRGYECERIEQAILSARA